MVIKSCKECGGQVSSTAKTCPHCGHAMQNPVAIGCGGLVLLCFLGLLGVGYCTDQTPIPERSAKNEADVAELGKAEAAISNALRDPKKVELMECAGVKVYEDPQPPGHPPSPEECAQIERQANIPPDDVAKLITVEEKLNDKCRGGSGDEASTEQACNDREAIISQIMSKGWCWGPDDKPEYQKDWMPCSNSGQ